MTLDFLAQFKRWDVLALCISMGVVFTFEMMGVFGSRYMTITSLVRQYIPFWLRAMILGWMCWHFMSK